jgi:rod shape-determining protein MreD
MRRAWLGPAVLAVAIVLQLAVLDGLHLPRGGVPDLVLVLVVALAMADGPVPGMVTGFAAGLCLDIAPPGSGAVGQYALVCGLAGWAAGSLGRLTRRSPLRALAVAAFVIIVAETMAAALALVLAPTQVTVAEIREFLPITVAYDLLLSPFALYAVILAATTKAGRGLAGSPLAETGLAGTGLLTVSGRPKRATHQGRPREPRLNPAAGRARDGWVSIGPASHPGMMRLGPPRKLHPGGGAPGSASGYAQQPRLPARPVNLRLSSRRRGAQGTVAVPAQYQRQGRHPGAPNSAGRQFHFGGESGGSAARQHVVPGPRPSEVRINFRAHTGNGVGPAGGGSRPGSRDRSAGLRLRMNGSKSALAPSARAGLVSPVPRLRMSGGRSALAPSAHAGLLRPVPRLRLRGGQSALAPSARVGLLRPVPRLRLRGGQSALASSARAGLPRAVPTMHFSTAPARIARKPVAAPKFRRTSGLLSTSRPATGLVSGGALEQSTFRARRTALGTPRLGLAGRRRPHGLGMVGGSGQSMLRRPPARVRKQPRFSYGRRSPLTFLAGRRLGGRWLARRRAGRRSGAWLIGKRTGGSR